MLSITRWFPRFIGALVLVACADRAAPTEPTAANLPSLSEEATPGELEALLPEGFVKDPVLRNYWTDAGFIEREGTAYGESYMEYLATNAVQDQVLTLRFDNRTVATQNAHSERGTIFPWFYDLLTLARVGVSGSCGHLVDAVSIHKAWNQFFVKDWKFFSWGTIAQTSQDDDRQSDCAPPPPQPPGSGGGPDEYEGGCEQCQEWLYYIDGYIAWTWWECEEIDGSYCESGSLR